MVEKIPSISNEGDQPSRYRTQNDDQVPGGFDFIGSTSGMVTNPIPQPQQPPQQEEIVEDESLLQNAAMSIPDMDALSVSSLHTTSTDRAADEEANANLLDEEPISTSEQQIGLDDTTHDMDWNHLLGLSGQGLNAANAATSIGFAAARQTTAFSLSVAKRFTQGLLALPAMALDGTIMGNAPNTQNYRSDGGPNSSSSIAGITHAAVGGIFDVISTLAVGGIDIGTAITGAGLGAVASGVEGVRRALGSEVLRSLGAFSRLVRREWHSASDTLPPGGIPAYSILGITQAMTAWVCIQMVTREYYEKKMLKNLEVVDLEKIHSSIKAAKEKKEQEEAELINRARIELVPQDTEATSQPSIKEEKQKEEPVKKKKKQVRILDDEELPGDEGDVIDAEIGSAADAAISAVLEEEKPEIATDTATNLNQPITPPTGLNDEEAVFGLKRYSKLVLGVYGGVALAWLGSLPPDLMQAAGTVVDGEAATVTKSPNTSLPNPNSNESSADEPLISGRPRGRSAAQDDAADFLRAAASLDLEDGELIDDEAGSVLQAETSISSKPASASLTPRQSISIPPTGEVLFSTEDDDNDVVHSPSAQATTSVDRTEATPSFAGAGTTSPQQPGRSYSYYDILMGTADGDIFHKLGGLEQGLAQEGNYQETASQAGSAAERLRRLNNRVARPSKPRYYVVTDHTQRKIVLVLRGSLTLGDIAIDLTCESANFDEQWSDEVKHKQEDDESASIAESDSEAPVSAEDFSPEAIRERAEQRKNEAEERRSKPQAREHKRGEFIVHEGMYETAKEIGEIGRPVHRAVRRAMLAHPGYALDITGHSLGAGVAALLAIMWASPDTGLTTKSSGLPTGRKTHAYCFAVPCVMGVKLGKRAEPLVTSYCYSYDLVCRLSLGAILDIRNACAWLAYENSQSSSTNIPGTGSNPSTSGLAHPIRLTNIMQRAFVHQSGRIVGQNKLDLEADFLALRKTLEANMKHVELYPPGVVLYSLSQQDITEELQTEQAKLQVSDRMQSGRLTSGLSTNSSHSAAQKAILYRLRSDGHREEVFDQIIHSRGMLSLHMPSVYHLAVDAL